MGDDNRVVKVDRNASSSAIWAGVSLGEANSRSTLTGGLFSSIAGDGSSAAVAGADGRSARIAHRRSVARATPRSLTVQGSDECFIPLTLPTSGRDRSPYGTRPGAPERTLLRAAEVDRKPGRNLPGHRVFLDAELAEGQPLERQGQELAVDRSRDPAGEVRPPADAHVTGDRRAVLSQRHRDRNERPSRGHPSCPDAGHVDRRRARCPLCGPAAGRQHSAQHHRHDDRPSHRALSVQLTRPERRPVLDLRLIARQGIRTTITEPQSASKTLPTAYVTP